MDSRPRRTNESEEQLKKMNVSPNHRTSTLGTFVTNLSKFPRKTTHKEEDLIHRIAMSKQNRPSNCFNPVEQLIPLTQNSERILHTPQSSLMSNDGTTYVTPPFHLCPFQTQRHRTPLVDTDQISKRHVLLHKPLHLTNELSI